jgi:Surp module
MMEDQNEEQAPVDEDVRKAKQGKVTGIIIPPPDIRAVVDKTAQFVARNGKSFEQRILSSGEGKTAKFNFMKQFDPYHAYYEQKIRYSTYRLHFFVTALDYKSHDD